VQGGHGARLTEFLTTHIIIDTIAFSRASWEELNGFDPTFDPSVFLWDFCIRKMRLTNGVSTGIPAAATEGSADMQKEQYVSALLHSDAYRQVISRHQEAFEENAEQLIELLTQYLHLPQHE